MTFSLPLPSSFLKLPDPGLRLIKDLLFYLCIMGYTAGKQDGGYTENGIEEAVVALNLPLFDITTKDLFPFIVINLLRKVNLMLKRGFVVLKLAKNSVVIYLPLDSVLAVET